MKVRALYFVEITVADWPAAVAWYRDVLGLELLHHAEEDQFALLGAGPARLALKGGAPNPGTVQLTFEVEDVCQAADQLAATGIIFEAPIMASPEGYRDVLLRDPDGYRVCLFDWGGAGSA
jgi:catechol 2,3-dioxygenase-like lactoylglutathione lyase family enzyme